MYKTALLTLFEQHNTTYEASALVVYEKRKVVHVLCYGVLDSIDCFQAETPSPSFSKSATVDSSSSSRVTSSSNNKRTIVPNGWKVVVKVDKKLWIAEIIFCDGRPKYRLSLLDESASIVKSSSLSEAPLGAYRQFFEPEDQHLKQNGVNARLFFGCHYEIPQHRILQYFEPRASLPAFVSQQPCVQREFLFLRASYALTSTAIQENIQKRMLVHQEQQTTATGHQSASATSSTDSPTKKSRIDDEETELAALLTLNMSSWVGW